MQQAIWLVCAAILLSGCGGRRPDAVPGPSGPTAAPSRATAAPCPTDLDPPPSSEEVQDGSYFAEDLGVCLEEAVTYLRRQEKVGRLGGALQDRGPEAFVELEIDYNPYRIVIHATEREDDAYRGFARENGFEDLVPFMVFEVAPFSQEQLEAAAEEIDEVAGDLRFDLNIDTTGGRVELITDDPETLGRLRALVASGRLRSPPEIYRIIDSPMIEPG